MKELIEAFSALEAAVVKAWGQIPAEIETEFKKIASLINLATPSSDPTPTPPTETPTPTEGAE